MLRQYGERGWSIREDNYVKIAAGGIGVGFTAGDGVVIEGCREESINGSHVLEAAEDGRYLFRSFLPLEEAEI